MTKSRSNATAPNAKGTLVVGNGTDASTTLAVASTAGYVLTVDSAQATGLKWAAASSTPTFVGCAAISTSATNVGNNTWTAVAFQSERFDTDSFHDNSTNNSRITIPAGKGGYYLVIYRSGFESITTNDCIMKLYKNGSAFDEGYTYSTISKVSSPYIKADMHSSAIVSLAAGDYIQLYVLQASGGSSDTWNENRLSVQFLGA